MIESLIPFLKEFGFPVALCGVLLLALRHQNKQLVKAYTDRISTLEGIVKTQGSQITTLQGGMLNRTQEYAISLKDVAMRYAAATHEVFSTLREILPVLRQLVASINRCQGRSGDYDPHPPPHPGDLPCDPKERPTDKQFRHA